MAAHARRRTPRRGALRAVVTASTVGAAVLAAGSAASAAEPSRPSVKVGRTDVGAALGGVVEGGSAAIAPVKNLNLNPLADTPVDPIDNGVGTQVADFNPISTQQVTGPLAHRNSLSTLPVVGQVLSTLPL